MGVSIHASPPRAHRGPGTDPGPAEAKARNPSPHRDGRLAGLSNKLQVRTKAKSQLRQMPRRGRSQRSGKVSLRKGHLPELRARVRVQEEKEGSGISEGGQCLKEGVSRESPRARKQQVWPRRREPGGRCVSKAMGKQPSRDTREEGKAHKTPTKEHKVYPAWLIK